MCGSFLVAFETPLKRLAKIGAQARANARIAAECIDAVLI